MTRKPDPYGRDATRPYHIPLKGWWQVAQRVWIESGRDNLTVVSAGCAFYALFAIFPALSALISLYGLTTAPTTVENQFSMLSSVLPTEAYDIVIQQIRNLAESSNRALGWSFALSIGLALWSVMSLTQAIFAALNIAYEEEEKRGFVRFYLSAFTFALVGIIGGVVMLLAIVYVPILFAYAGYSHGFEQIVAIARWPLLALLVLVLLAALYRFGPCRRRPKWMWVSVGSVFSTTLWLVASAGFSYLRGALRPIRQDLRLARRGDRAAVLALSQLLHHPAWRRDQRRTRAADGGGHDARQAPATRQARRVRRRSRGGRTARQPPPGEPGCRRPVQGRAGRER